MSTEMTLTKTRLHAGKWEGILTVPESHPAPQIEVLVHDEKVDDIAVAPTGTPGEWGLVVSIPPETITEGTQVFLIRDRASGKLLGNFAVLAGEEVSDTVHAEIVLLRAELDMLKRAFRRHCVETGAA